MVSEKQSGIGSTYHTETYHTETYHTETYHTETYHTERIAESGQLHVLSLDQTDRGEL